jgi:hypothetical protein
VGLDEAGAGDHVVAVDHPRAGCAEVGADRDNGAVADMDVAVRQIANSGVHGDDEGVADQDLVRRRQVRRRRLGLRDGAKHPRRACGGRGVH